MRLAFLLFFTLLSFSAGAVQPDEVLKDPVLEARAREISKNVRCLVCQGEAIDESNAGLARDLRLLVRERLKAGDSDAEIYAHLRARFGDYVLMSPPVEARTFFLWFGPFMVLCAGAAAVFMIVKRKS